MKYIKRKHFLVVIVPVIMGLLFLCCFKNEIDVFFKKKKKRPKTNINTYICPKQCQRALLKHWVSSSFFRNQTVSPPAMKSLCISHFTSSRRQIPPQFAALAHTYPPTTLIPGVSTFILMELDKAWIWPALFIHAVNAVTVHPSNQTQDSYTLFSVQGLLSSWCKRGDWRPRTSDIAQFICSDLYRLAGKS